MVIIDLTHHLEEGMPLYPGTPPPSFKDMPPEEAEGFAVSGYQLSNHLGTHVDAPSHRIAAGETLDDIGLERLVTDAVTLDFRDHRKGALSLADLEPHLHKLAPGDFLFICSGDDANWGSDAYWTDWCYPDEQASRAAINRGVSGVGFDGPSADPVDTSTFELHELWLGAGRLIIENLCNLDQLPERTPVVVAPMKVRGANGAPARVIALPDLDGAARAISPRQD